jgi:hypothetical protein
MKDSVKRYFDGLCNGDAADFAVAPNEYINCENFRFGPNGGGKFRRMEAIESHNLRYNRYLPSGINKAVGAFRDDEGGRIIQFNWNENGEHAIYSYEDGTWYKVLLDADVTGGLGFDPNYMVHSASVVKGKLYYCYRQQEPHSVNIEAGIKANHSGYTTLQAPYTFPLAHQVFTLIRRPPNYPLTVEKKVAASLTPAITLNNNQVGNHSFKFTYYYDFRDKEQSTLAMHSALIPYNFKDEQYDIIEIKVPLTELISQDVQRIRLVVKYQDRVGENGYIIKTWDKAKTADLAEITAHNAGSQALTFYFSNSEVGAALDSAYLVKPFDPVPLWCNTLRNASKRMFLGNYLTGYDAPTLSSLTADVVEVTGEIDVEQAEYAYMLWWLQTPPPEYGLPPGEGYSQNIYFLYLATAIGSYAAGYYARTENPFGFIAGTAVDMSDFTFVSAAIDAAMSDFVIDAALAYSDSLSWVTDAEYRETTDTGDISIIVSDGGSANLSIHKMGSTKKTAIVFYDRFMRQCAAVPCPDYLTIPDIPDGFDASTVYGIGWALSNASALLEIPDWAYFYSIVCTKDLTHSFFVQSKTKFIAGVKYVTKDADGAYVFTETDYSDEIFGVAIDISQLASRGLGYTYQENDVALVHIKTGSLGTDLITEKLLVKDQYAEWVILEPFNFGNLTAKNGFFELYSPTPQAAGQFYYEQGAIYPVTNPATNLRAYSTLSGTIPGDVFLLIRGTDSYFTENMSPNTTYWKNWFTHAGRVQVTDIPGQAYLPTARRWSNVYTEETSINGLSSFDGPDQRVLSPEVGPIQRIMIAGKVAGAQGNVMVTVCKYDAVSTYLGEVQLVANDGVNEYLASSSEVLGNDNPMKKNRSGTMHPESVIENDGNVYWVDVINERVTQYSNAGLQPVNEYKMKRYWKLFSQQYNRTSSADFARLGSYPLIPSGYDVSNKEWLIGVPRLLPVAPKGELFDYASGINYPYDIWDGQGKTMVYRPEDNGWQGSYRFEADCFVTADSVVYSFKNGRMYSHDDDSRACNFHGKQQSAKLMIAENQQDVSMVKVGKGIAIEALKGADFTHIRTEKPWIQSSDIDFGEWKRTEGVYYAPMRRDRLTPAVGATTNAQYITALTRGIKMRSDTFLIMLQYDCLVYTSDNQVTQELPWIKFIDVSFAVSKGHAV